MLNFCQGYGSGEFIITFSGFSLHGQLCGPLWDLPSFQYPDHIEEPPESVWGNTVYWVAPSLGVLFNFQGSDIDSKLHWSVVSLHCGPFEGIQGLCWDTGQL